MTLAIFLDRDNTIIENDGYLGDPNQVKLIKGAASAIASLRGLGYKIVVVTNQSGVARGLHSEADVEAVNNRVAELVKQTANGASIDAFYYCPYLPGASVAKYDQDHPSRKPKPGMLTQAAKDMKLDLSLCWMVGDADRDIEAGQAAGVRSILIGDNVGDHQSTPEYTAESLIEAARIIATHLRPEADADEKTKVQVVKTMATPAEPINPKPGPVYPANQPLDTSAGDSGEQPPAKTARPFKPWTIQPVSREQEVDLETSTRRATGATRTEDPTPPVEVEPPEQPAETEPQPVQEIPASPEPPAEPAPKKKPRHKSNIRPKPRPQVVTESITTEPRTEPAEPAPPAVESETKTEPDPTPIDETPPTTSNNTDRLLSQILRQLKHNQMHYADWTLFKVLGLGIAQPLAIACLLIGLFSGGAALGNWLTGAVFCQLVVITCLMLQDRT